MLPSQFIMALVDRNDEIEYLFMVIHTHEWDRDAFTAIENQLTTWLLTPEGRKFVLGPEFNDTHFPWGEICTAHPEVILATPGITKLEYLPYQAFAVGQDDNPSPWSISVDRLTGKRRIYLDKDMIEELLKKGITPCNTQATPPTPPSPPPAPAT